MFAGQLSIGWSNDAIDAARDRATQRSDKPVAQGAVSTRVVGVAAGLALLAAVVLSLALGWQPGLASLTVVACGWLYNLGLKATAFSFVPYAIAFGTLPAVATLALPEPAWPAPWAMVAGALFGVSAHLANVLPDLDDDLDTGVRGLPHRIGARATAVACPVLLGAASLVILFGTARAGRAPGAGWRRRAWSLLAGAGVVAGLRQPKSRALFVIVIAAAISRGAAVRAVRPVADLKYRQVRPGRRFGIGPARCARSRLRRLMFHLCCASCRATTPWSRVTPERWLTPPIRGVTVSEGVP